MKIFLATSTVIILMVLFSCQETDPENKCRSATLIGTRTECQVLGDSRELALFVIDHQDTVLALYPNEEVFEIGTTLSIRFDTIDADSLVCKAIVTSRPLIEITNLTCN